MKTVKIYMVRKPSDIGYENFCNELEKLSRKYGIVIQAVGGVIQNTNGFQGYNPDLDSGDLIPEWKE